METSDSRNPWKTARLVEKATSTKLSRHERRDVERVGIINADNSGLSSSYADYGIRPEPKLQNSFSGKIRSIQNLNKKEIIMWVISAISLLVSIGFTISKAATLDKHSSDFVFTFVILGNSGFCIFYVIHGVMLERPYELFIFVVVVVIKVIYLIANFILSARGAEKLVRLILGCFIDPVLIVLGLWIGVGYLRSGKFIFHAIGANADLQLKYRTMSLFLDFLILDLQLGITMVALIMTAVDTWDIAILVVGVIFTVVWFILGHLAVRFESKRLMFVFWALFIVEIGYIIFRVVKASKHLKIEEVIAIVTFVTGLLAVIVRSAVIVLSYFVLRNFGFRLKEKVYGTDQQDAACSS